MGKEGHTPERTGSGPDVAGAVDLLRGLFAHSRDGIGMSRVSTLVAANPAMVRLFGYADEAELVGRSVLDIIAPPARTTIAEYARRRSMGEPVPPLYVTEGLRRDGATFPLQVRSTTFSVAGEVHILAILQDLTHERTVEHVARDKEGFYRALFDVNPAIKLLISPATGRILDANQAAVEFYGWPVDVLRTMRISDINVLSEEELLEEMEKARSGRRRYFRFRHRTAHGDIRHVEVHSGPVTLGHEQVLLSIIHDVTERDALEAQLREAQRLEAIGRLAGGVAHDFNNLLTVIFHAAEMVERGLPGESEVRPHVDDLRHAAQRAAGLTRQLLAFSRRQVMRPAVMQLNGVVDGLRGLLQRTLGANYLLDARLDGALPPVRVDPAQLEQVLVNLILNARDAMPKGGRITVRTAMAHVEEGALHAIPPGTWVTLCVQDQGHGMDEETRSRCFEPFFTTKGSQEGTGLGLATVYGIMAQSGGHVAVESHPGEGACFSLYLPVAEAPLAAEDRPERQRPARASGRILLVDDDDAVRVALAAGLTQAGFQVQQAGSAAEALEHVLASPEPPDALVTDVVMPYASGVELAMALRERHPEVRVLLISGDLRDHDLSGLPPDTRILQKPFTADRLVYELASLLTCSSAVPAADASLAE
jgi:two-component system, cell cycle sensor histidine kinase and response regulator CckA